VRQTVKWTFVWSMAIAVIFMGIYHFGGVPLVRMMTSDAAVVEQSKEFLPWLLLMPVVGCAAFTWDGIYVGATASKAIRNAMLWAVAAFVLVWVAGIGLLHFFPTCDTVAIPMKEAGAAMNVAAPTRHDILAMHVLMAAYFAHLLARTIHLTFRYRKIVLDF
ncbi:MAG: hypothetical protein J6J61_02180, partial [Muribaculaceae bacterium]|nr:hypothetical protein [Muribaculaceae bacterium]